MSDKWNSNQSVIARLEDSSLPIALQIRAVAHEPPDIPAASYVPGSRAVNRMIAVGERATYQALERFSSKQVA